MPTKNDPANRQLEALINTPSAEEIVFLSKHNLMKYGMLRAMINDLGAVLSQKKEIKRFALVTNSLSSMLIALCACLKSSKIPVLLPSTSCNCLTAHINDYDEILTDTEDPALRDLKCNFFPKRQITASSEAKVCFPAVLPDILLFTSGSSGDSKQICKHVSTMLQEGYMLKDFLLERFPDLIKPAICIAASVTARHLYGLTFSIFLPLVCKMRIYPQRIRYTEELLPLKDPLIFISSPAFLKRLDRSFKSPHLLLTFCAGGVLDDENADDYIAWSKSQLLDIYGSTETGVIAYKIKNSRKRGWTAFYGMKLKPSQLNFTLSSPLLDDDFTVSDRITLLKDGSFILEGRSDDIVKIEEKRISLNKIKLCLLKLPGIKDAECLPYVHQKRTFIAALVVLEPDEYQLFQTNHTKMIIKWRNSLLGSLMETAIPRKFKIIEAFDENENGKRPRAMLERLLLDN